MNANRDAESFTRRDGWGCDLSHGEHHDFWSWASQAHLKESAEIALSWANTYSYDLGITNEHALDPLRIPDA